MAISVPSKSSQYTDYTSSPQKNVIASDWGSKLRTSYAKLTFTAAGFTSAAAGDISLIRMPAGKVRINSNLSRVVCPQGTTGCTLDIGLGAYTKPDGTSVAAAGAALASALAVGTAAVNQSLPAPAGGITEIESTTGFDVVCSFATANSPAAGDLVVAIVYQVGN